MVYVLVKSGFRIGYCLKFKEKVKSSEFNVKSEFILFPEPKIFLSSIPKVTPAPVSALKVPAKSILPVLISSSISIVISTNWSLISVEAAISLMYGYLFRFFIDLSNKKLLKYCPGSIDILDLIVLFLVIELPVIFI